MLSVFVDFKSPASYLALQPTLDLARDLGVEMIWRPFLSTERPAPTQVNNETVGESHRRVRALSRRQLQAHYADVQGIDMRWPNRETGADYALAVLAAAAGNPEAYVVAAFRAYWVDNSDLNDPSVVRGLIDVVGLQASDPSLWRQALVDAQTAAENAGVVDAPAYIVKDQIFVGREHLPWIRELVAQG